jgi:hypothetical protein
MYITNLINEIKLWKKVRLINIENETILNNAGFRVDWIGRIYTVINLPEEVVTQPVSREGYILMKLREFDQMFLDMGIADAVSPEMEEIPKTDSYLLILSPDRDYIKFIPFLISFVKTIVLIIILRIIYVFIYHHFTTISSYASKLYNLIF